MPELVRFMGVTMRLVGKADALEAIDAATPKRTVRLATANPEFMLDAQRNRGFKRALEDMTHVTVDGTGLAIALRLFSPHKPELYHGSDLVADLFERYANGERSFYMVGGGWAVAKTAAHELASKYPKLKIVGAEDGGWLDKDSVYLDSKLEERIRKAKPDILLVGYGAPKQELWIDAARHLPVPVMMGIGGSFEFFGTKKRAPGFIRAIHMEWMYRAFTEKGHWKRSFRAFAIFAPYSFLWWVTSPLRRS